MLQRQVRFKRVAGKVLVKVCEALVQRQASQVRFNRVPEKVPKKVGCTAGEVQQSSEKGLARLW